MGQHRVRGLTLRLIAAVAVAAVALATPVPGVAQAPAPDPVTALTPDEQRIENVISAALRYLGVPYRLGAEGPDLMDCSGLVYRSFKDAGEGSRISGARLGVRSYVRWFAARGALVLDPDDAVRGDLPIYGAGQHMGIYLGDGRAISALMSGVKVHPVAGLGLPLTGFLRPDWSGAGKVEPLDPSLLLDRGETPVELVPASAWAPTLDPFADGAQPERTGEERVDMRTATSRTFDNGDGTFTTELHVQPIHYQAPDSTDWLPIDLRFGPVEPTADQPAQAAVSASPVVIHAFPSDSAGGFLTLAAGGRALSIAAAARDDVTAATPSIAADGRSMDYFDFYADGTGLRVYARPDGARAFVVLRDEPEANRFSFRLAGPDLTAALELDGAVALHDGEGTLIGRIARPKLFDSSDVAGDGGGVFTAAASLTVAQAADGAQVVTLTVGRRYLEEAVYPAFVDFSVVDFPAAAPGAGLAAVSSRHPNAVFVGAERPEQPGYGELWLGRQPGSRNDNVVYVRFDDPRSAIGDADIQRAALELYPYWGNETGATAAVRGVTAAWTPESISWLTQPAAEVDLGTISLTAGAWSSLDLGGWLMQSGGDMPDNGLMLAAAQPGPGSWTRLIARDQSEEIAFGPRLVVTWSGLRPMLGLAEGSDWYSPVLAWANAPVFGDQWRYEVQVSADGFATAAAGSGVMRGQAGSATSWVVPTDELGYGTYFARVRARPAEAGWSEWSAPFSFHYWAPPLRPTRWHALECVDGYW